MRMPHTVPGKWPEPIAPSRFASLIRRDSPEGCRVAVLGLADDLGVKLNNGRPGAKEGPTAFRAALSRYGVAEPYGWEWPRVFDAGDIVPADGEDEAALHETHRRVTEATAAIQDLGLFPIGIGGGHDLTFPFVRAVAQRIAPRKLAGVYCDAHLDVRDTAGSGMPFRRLIEECGVGPLRVYGLDMYANSTEHYRWFKEHDGHAEIGEYPDEEHFEADRDSFLSIDLDVLDAAYSPGVSAINPAGWSPWTLETWAEEAGKSPNVRCFDIMELNPRFDIDGRTARTACYVLFEFLRGFSKRGASQL
jgi:formiminoglutamase